MEGEKPDLLEGMKTANFWARLNAYNIDLTILLLVLFPIGFAVEDNPLYYVICFSVVILYHGIFEGTSGGATPGKKLYRLKVVRMDGSAVGIPKSFLRILLKFVSAAIALIGFSMIGFHPKRQGLHDLIVGTIVLDMTEKK